MDVQEALREKAKEAEIREAGKRLLEERRAQAAALQQPAPTPAPAAQEAPPPIGPSDLTILLVVPAPAPSAEELKSRLSEKYGKVADVFVSTPKEGKKKARAIVEFASGNWGGCWACLRDAGGVSGAKAKWVGDEPKWVKWAESHGTSASSMENGAHSRLNGRSPTAQPTEEQRHLSNGASNPHSPSPAPSPSSLGSAPIHTDKKTTGAFPDIADLTASHAQRDMDQRAAQVNLAAANESATLLRMRQRERERRELEKQILAEEEGQ